VKKLTAVAILTASIMFGQGTAHAIPILQLYIEGATYDDVTETWVLAPPGSSSGAPFRVWAIGNVAGPGGKGPISDLKLSIAYREEYSGLSITLTGSQAGGLGVGQYRPSDTDPWVLDPRIADAPTYLQTVTDGSSPVLGDGSSLPTHGIFGAGTMWQEFSLGSFTFTDESVGDFIGSFPSTVSAGGQINAYEVSVIGGSGATLHFDLYDTIISRNDAVFAPFSHDADGTAHIAPEPASFIVWFLVGLSWAGSAWTHQYRRRWQKWQQEEAMATGSSRAGEQLDRFGGFADLLEEQVPLPTWAQLHGETDPPSVGG
jgi:hypothetical protein